MLGVLVLVCAAVLIRGREDDAALACTVVCIRVKIGCAVKQEAKSRWNRVGQQQQLPGGISHTRFRLPAIGHTMHSDGGIVVGASAARDGVIMNDYPLD